MGGSDKYTVSRAQNWQPQQLNYRDIRRRESQLLGDDMCVKNLTTWLEIVLRGAEVPGPQRFSFVIGASERATLHGIVRETSESSAPVSPPDII